MENLKEIARYSEIIMGIMIIVMVGFRFYKNLVIDHCNKNRKKLFKISLTELIFWVILASLFIYVSFYRFSNQSSDMFIHIQDTMFLLLFANMFLSNYIEKYRIKLRKEND